MKMFDEFGRLQVGPPPMIVGGSSMSIGGSVIGGTTGSILFIGPGPVLAEDNANLFFDDANNRVGIGTNMPSCDLSFGGNLDRVICVERIGAGVGKTLTVRSGGAQTGGTNLAAGDLILTTGTPTGNATANIQLRAAGGGASGTADAVAATVATILPGAVALNPFASATTVLRFLETTGGNFVGFRAPTSIASDVTWTLPAADGTSGQALVTNGAGTLTWASVAVGAHNLLSATHSDTVPASPVRGDLIVGNATPAWTRLPSGVTGAVLRTNGTGDPQWATGVALSKVDDTNILLTLSTGAATALLTLTTIQVEWLGVLSLARGGTNKNITASSGAVVWCDTDSFELTAVGTAGQVLVSGGTGAPSWQDVASAMPHALLDGSVHSDTVAQAVTRGSLIVGNATPKWDELVIGTSGRFLRSDGSDPSWQLIAATDVTSGQALSRVDDANVTLTLGGSPSTALLAATSLTLGWAGVLSLARGGTNKNITAVAGSVVWCDADSFELTAAGTTGQVLTSNGTGAPTWTTLGTSTHALLDSAVHTDTTTATVSRGSLIVGIGASPKWEELVIGAANRVLRSDGTDVGWAQVNLGTDVTGTLLVGNGGTGVTALSDVLGTTNQVNVSGGTARVIGGNVTLSTPQDIHTSATPQFLRMGLGAAADANHSLLISQGTITSDKHAIDILATWNSGATTFTGIKFNANITAAGLVSKLLDLQVDGAHRFRVTIGGHVEMWWPGEVRWYEEPSFGTNYVGFKSAITLPSTLIWQLPTADGSANHVLKTDGSLVLGFASVNSLITGAALTRVDDTNLTLTLGGTPSTALLQSVSLTLGWSGVLSLARGGTNKNITAVAGAVVWCDADSFELTAAGTSGQVLVSNGTSAPSWTTLSSVPHTLLDATAHTDTTTAVVSRGSLIVGIGVSPKWEELVIGAAATYLRSDGTDAAWSAGSALTKADDTNVTLTLGGAPSTALLAAASLTLGWTGVLSLARGGTNKNTTAVAGAVVWCDSDSFELTAAGTTGQVLTSNGTSAPTWTTPTGPTHTLLNAAVHTDTATQSVSRGSIIVGKTSSPVWDELVLGSAGQVLRSDGTDLLYSTFTIPNTFAQGDIIYSSAANTLIALSKDTNATRYLSNTGSSNNPAWAQVNLSNGVTGTLAVGNGGTGVTSLSDVLGTTNQVSVAGGTARVIGGNVTLSLPQDIHTAATPQFARLGLGAAADATALLATTGQVAIRINPYGAAAGNTGEIRFLELAANGTNYIALKSADAIGTSRTWVLPNDDGTNGQALTWTTGGVLAWATISSSSPHAILDGSTHSDSVAQAVTRGSIIVGNATPKWDELVLGASGTVLRSDGTDLSYSTFTVPNTFAQGDIIYASAANTLTALSKNTTATRYLSNTGASNNPAWAQVNLADGVTGTLPVANGGTGATVLDDIVGTANQITVTNGADTIIGGNVTLSIPVPLILAATLSANDPLLILKNTENITIGNTVNLMFYMMNEAAASVEYARLWARTEDDGTDSETGSLNISAKAPAGVFKHIAKFHAAYGDGNPFIELYGHLIFDPDVTLDIGDPTSRPRDIYCQSIEVQNINAIRLKPYDTASGETSQIQFFELAANGNSYVAFKAADSIVTDVLWTLPGADGTSGQVLSTNGSGALSWATVSGGGAPTNARYVVLAANATLTNEEVLTGTANQITVTASGTDGGNVTLSLPQNIHTGASPAFTGLTLSGLTQGSVLFAGSGGIISQDNTNFFWDDAANELGIGTNTPTGKLHCIQATASTDCARFQGVSSGGLLTYAIINVYNSSGQRVLALDASNSSPDYGICNVIGYPTVSGGICGDFTFANAGTGSTGDIRVGNFRVTRGSAWNVSDCQLVLRNGAGFTANIFYFTGAGLGGLNTSSPGGMWDITCRTAATTGLIVRGASSQTANLATVQTTGDTVFSIGPRGDISSTPDDASSGSITNFAFTASSGTGQTASTETIDANFNLARTLQHATGDITTQRAFLIQAPTYSFVGSSTITSAATFAVTGAPSAGTNATITNAYSIWQQGGACRIDSQLFINESVTSGRTFGIMQPVATSGSPNALVLTGGAHTTLAASTEASDVTLNLARSVQFSTGALTTQRAVLIQAPTYAFVGASTLTTAATLAITGAPIAGTNATITTGYALHISTGYAAAVGLLIKGATSQTGNFLQLRSSTDFLLTYLDSNGDLSFYVGSGTTARKVFVADSTSGNGAPLRLQGGAGTGTNRNAGGLIADSGNSTGTGSGTISFYLAPAGTTGSGVNASALFSELSNVGLSIGTATHNDSRLFTTQTQTATVTTHGVYADLTANPSGDSGAGYLGLRAEVQTHASMGGNLTGADGLVGAFLRVSSDTSGRTVTNLSALNAEGAVNAGTVTNLYGGKIVAVTGGTCTNAYGLYVDRNASTGTVTNAYGLYLDVSDTNPTNNYGVYQAGIEATNIFEGTVQAPGSFLRQHLTSNTRVTHVLLTKDTTDATVTELTRNGSAPDATNRFLVASGRTYSCVLNLCARQSGGSNSKQFLRQFVIENTGGTTALVGVVTTLGTDIGSAGATTWAITVTADNTNDSVKIEVAGVAATNIRWHCYLVANEVEYT